MPALNEAKRIVDTLHAEDGTTFSREFWERVVGRVLEIRAAMPGESAGDALTAAVAAYPGKEFRVSDRFQHYLPSVQVVDAIPRDEPFRPGLNVMATGDTLDDAIANALDFIERMAAPSPSTAQKG